MNRHPLFARSQRAGLDLHVDVRVNGDIENKKRELLGALHAADMSDAPRGPFKLDEYGHATQNVYIRQVQKHDGSMVNVPIKAYQNVSQFTAYDNMK